MDIDPRFRCYRCQSMANPPVNISRGKQLCDTCVDAHKNACPTDLGITTWLSNQCSLCPQQINEGAGKSLVCTVCAQSDVPFQLFLEKLQRRQSHRIQNLACIGQHIDQLAKERHDLHQQIHMLSAQVQQLNEDDKHSNKLLEHYWVQQVCRYISVWYVSRS